MRQNTDFSIMHSLPTTRSHLSPVRCVCVFAHSLIRACPWVRVTACLHARNFAALVQWHGMFWSVRLHTTRTVCLCICYFIGFYSVITAPTAGVHIFHYVRVCTLINYADGRIDTGGGIYLRLFNHPQHINTLTNTNTESAIIRFGSVMMLMSSD